jgi:hypothetical protein
VTRLAGLVVTLFLVAPATAQPPPARHAAKADSVRAAPAALPVAPAKKLRYLAAKQAEEARAALARRKVGQPAADVVSIYNTWTHEWLVLDPTGPLPDGHLVDRFLRCHFTDQPTHMDARLIKTLRAAARHFGKDRVEIVSGFRAPKYNLMLRKKGHEVARDSQHTHGTAVDFRIPGVDVHDLERWARSLHMGGVGLYVGSGFVHVDTGRVRYWGGT